MYTVLLNKFWFYRLLFETRGNFNYKHTVIHVCHLKNNISVRFPLILLKTYKNPIEYNSIKWSSIEIFDLFIQYRLIDLSRTWCLRNGYLSIKIELQLICKFDSFSLSSALPFVTNDDLFIRKHYAILKWRDNSIIENKK